MCWLYHVLVLGEVWGVGGACVSVGSSVDAGVVLELFLLTLI